MFHFFKEYINSCDTDVYSKRTIFINVNREHLNNILCFSKTVWRRIITDDDYFIIFILRRYYNTECNKVYLKCVVQLNIILMHNLHNTEHK